MPSVHRVWFVSIVRRSFCHSIPFVSTFSLSHFSLFQNSNSAYDFSPPISANHNHNEQHTSSPITKTNTYTSMSVKTQNTCPSDSSCTNSHQLKHMPLSKSTSMRSMVPLKRSDTLNFVQNDPEALQYRPFISSHSSSHDTNAVAPTLSKSISFGGNANTIASNMYDDDIDFMNNYLKSLPDYNELNKKISNEHKKCTDIYDKLKSINTSLQSQSNRLPKSNSFHSICPGASTKPFAMQSISVDQSANGIEAKNKNSTINRNAMASTAKPSSTIGTDKIGIKPAISSSSTIVASPSSSVAVAAKPTIDLNDVSRKNQPLPKSASSSCVNMNNMPNDTNGTKKCLNDFWSEHLARNNQQKFGWNYNRIMAVQKANKQPPIENLPSAAMTTNNSYKLQKNMSLSQLDKSIRQDLSREELYNLICNSDQSTINRSNAQPPQHQPLSKSVSQTSVPSSSFAVPVKISRKPSIPTLFKPLCKSTSNTHVFNRNYDISDEPRETFTPKLLVKSCSSSSVFGHMPSSSQIPNNHNNNNYNHPIDNSIQSRILRNNESLKNAQAQAQTQPHHMKVLNENAIKMVTSLANDSHQPMKQMAANEFFIKQNVPQPNKVIVNYPTYKSASSAQIPLHSNLPPTFGHPTSLIADNKNYGSSVSTAPTTNFYHSNAQMLQPKQIPMYSTSSSTTTTTTTSVGSKNNNLSQTAVAQMKCKNEVNQQNELLKQPTTPSNSFPNKMNFIEIDSNRNAKLRPYVVSIGGDTSTFNSSMLAPSSSFRNGCAGNSTIVAVHCPSNSEQQHKFVTSKPDPMEKIPRRMPVQPTTTVVGAPATKKLPHSFSSSCVSDLLRANASSTISNPSHIGRPMQNIPSNQIQNNFTAQTQLYSRLYSDINFSSQKPLHNSVLMKSNVIEGQPQQPQPRHNGQIQTTMSYKPFTQPYALTQSKSATAISRKDTSWLERHGYEIVDMSTSMQNDEVAEKSCAYMRVSCLVCAYGVAVS